MNEAITEIKHRLESIPDDYLRTLRPSIQQLLRRDIPELISQIEFNQRAIDALGGIVYDLRMDLLRMDADQSSPANPEPTQKSFDA
jgi:hypothetical protein